VSLTLTLDEGGLSTPRPGRFTPGKETRYPNIGGWEGPRAGLEGCGKYRPHRDSIPGQSSPLRVTIPTELSKFSVSKGMNAHVYMYSLY
jgi:hypothetical protein